MYLQENGNDYRNKSEEVIDRYGFFVSPEELNAEESIDRIVLRRREQKWLEMFASWDVYIGEKFEKLKQRCRKGIPPALRGRAWFYLSSAEFRRKRAEQEYNLENVFEYYSTKQPAANVLNDIEKDLARSFPDHEMFRTDGFGQKGLYDVLKAYAVHDPAVGYCQAQAPIAGILLMHLPAEDAFWVFVQINEEYVRGYFSDGLIAIKEDALATEILVQRICPKGYQILKKLDVDPILYTLDWYMTLFTRTYKAPRIHRIWDIFFCEGVKVLFRISLAILIDSLESNEAEKCDNAIDLVSFIKFKAKQLTIDQLLIKMDQLKLHDYDLTDACRQARLQLENEGQQNGPIMRKQRDIGSKRTAMKGGKGGKPPITPSFLRQKHKDH